MYIRKYNEKIATEEKEKIQNNNNTSGDDKNQKYDRRKR